jgi:hypothetical protein
MRAAPNPPSEIRNPKFFMSASGIKAGKAYVAISAKDELDKDLAAIKSKLQRWGAALGVAGGAIAASGAGALAAIGAMARAFADQGGGLYDAAAATGVSTEALSGLKYAAESAGATFDDVVAGLRGVAKFTKQVAAGGGEAGDALAKMGISASQWLAASPSQRLALVADALQRVKDPSLRAALAMSVLGKAGAALLPAMADGAAGLDAAIRRAAELGLIVSPKDAAKADALGDAWYDLTNALGAVGFRIGAAVADALRRILDLVTPLIVGVGRFVEQNQALVVAFAATAVAAVAVGFSLMFAGGALIALGAVIGSLTAIFAALSAVVAAVLSPIGLVIAGIVALAAVVLAGIVAFVRYTTIGQQMFAVLANEFRKLWEIAKQALGGIVDALAAGRLDLAAKVATAGMYVAFQQLWTNLRIGFATIADYIVQSMLRAVDAVRRGVFKSMQVALKGIEVLGRMLGLPTGNLDLAKQLLAMGDARAGKFMKAARQGSRDVRDAAVDAAQAALRKAQEELAAATANAAKSRADADEAARKKAQSLSGGGGDQFGIGVGSPSSVLGTFSGAVAGLLGRSGGDSAAERTAKATEEIAEDMAAVKRKLEGTDGLAFV